MTAKSMRLATLPLLGSNQDSPDPESGARLRLRGAARISAVDLAQISAEPHTISPTIFHPAKGDRRYQVECKRGHPLAGENVTIKQGKRHCRTCANARRRGDLLDFRANEPGKVLARGPLDYDRPVVVRCAVCRGVFERPLADIGSPCPHCQRYPEAVA